MNLAIVDFDNRAKEITFNFANNIAEPLTLKLKFIESDHASFDAKEAESKSFLGKLLFLYLFVAIPLPGTGGWTGALVASFMNIKLKYSIPIIFAGVFTAGIIMSVICYVLPELAAQWFGFSF